VLLLGNAVELGCGSRGVKGRMVDDFLGGGSQGEGPKATERSNDADGSRVVAARSASCWPDDADASL
jgi:hypothetical protein